ncbi:MAG TPA: HlyD family efflux transporter periplasmic adaptor subunit [Candidatus Faecousia intestinavium]|nr:HlyD family efflux transporter periplasmic adaptor subunit [Candidatus Faecousia intestinavium]
MEKQLKKQRRRYIAWGCAAALVILLAVMPMAASGADDTPQAAILSGQVTRQELETQILGGGLLSGEGALSLDIPADVKITEYLVSNGDSVTEGEPIATVDRVSVMNAITQVQETLDYLSDEISAARSDTAPTTVTALASGTVKVIYAQEDDLVSDVMLENGALAVLSLDDKMAVQVEADTDLAVDAPVIVTLEDGTQVSGAVKSNIQGKLTVTVEDEDYTPEQTVQVTLEDGTDLGSGALYIHSPWNAFAYSGTVSRISVSVGQKVSAGQTLMTLTDTGHTAEYQQLVDQHQQYEELMQELFQLYQSGSVTAPCDGIVTGVDTDGAYLLRSEGSWIARLLGFGSSDEEESFLAFSARVEQATEDGLILSVSGQFREITDLSQLSFQMDDKESLTQSWTYTGSTRLYSQTEDGLLEAAGTAQPGDLVIVVGNEEQPLWLVAAKDSSGFAGISLLSQTDDPSEPQDDTQALPLEESGTPDLLDPSSTPASEPAGSADQGGSSSGGTDQGGSSSGGTDQGGSSSGSTDPSGSSSGGTDQGGSASGGSDQGGSASGNTDPSTPPAVVSIVTSSLPQATVGQPYSAQLQASDGSNPVSGTWSVTGLPEGITLDPATGTLSGTAAISGDYTLGITFTDGSATAQASLILTVLPVSQNTYWGYPAMLIGVGGGQLQVQQTPYAYTITDLQKLPQITVSEQDLSVEALYEAGSVDLSSLTAGQTVLLIVDQDGTLVAVSQGSVMVGGQSGGMNLPGMSGTGSFSGGSVGGGSVQTPSFETYTLEHLSIGSVTSQEHMSVEISVDELDISQLHSGQEAIVSVDALGGEQFPATLTRISSTGENEGGNTKFAVELTLEKSGEMLPGMTASVQLSLESHPDSLCVPAAAVSQLGSQSVVYTGYDEGSGTLTNPVVVTTGTSDGESVEILSGLEEGQVFYYAYYELP